MKTLFLLLTLVLFSGCVPSGCAPSGGGTVHTPPDEIVSNQPTELKITFSVWGPRSGRLDHRYTDVTCIYWVHKSGVYHRLNGSVVSADDENMEMKFVIPPLDLKVGDSVGYTFEMLFGGHKNTRPGGTLKVK